MSTDISRRGFLSRTSLYSGATLLTLNCRFPLAAAAARNSDSPAVLDRVEWKTVEAITGRVIPSEDGPGAIEANCVNFIDKALANEESESVDFLRDGISILNGAVSTMHQATFAEIPHEKQDALLEGMSTDSVENWPSNGTPPSELFEYLRFLTIAGFLAEPMYGGNAGHIGWQLAGYPGPRHHGGGYTAEQMSGEQPVRPTWDQKKV